MASKLLPPPLLRYFSKRGYAAALPAIKETKVQCSILPNNTFVAAVDNGSPVTRVTIAFKAGSRYEPATELGVSHLLRASAGLTTKNASTFILQRKLAQAGATLTASGDREFIFYTLETTQSTLNDALECITDLVSEQEFRPWEVSDITPRLKYDLVALSPQIRAIDLLHKGAYRRGLGNSLFISPKRIGSISSESLQHFSQTTLTPSRCGICIVGDTQEKAIMIAQNLKLPISGEATSPKSKFYGGEMRKEMGGDLTHVALAVEGAPAGTPDSLALAIAAKALGNGPIAKWGSDNSPLARAIGNIGPFAAAGFNVSYSDTGLFGVVLTVPKDEAYKAVKAVASVLRNAALDSQAIKTGRNQLKLQVLSEQEAGTNLSESVAVQGLYTATVKTSSQIAQDIDSVRDADVCAAMSRVAGTMAMGAVGNLAFCPYVDEL